MIDLSNSQLIGLFVVCLLIVICLIYVNRHPVCGSWVGSQSFLESSGLSDVVVEMQNDSDGTNGRMVIVMHTGPTYVSQAYKYVINAADSDRPGKNYTITPSLLKSSDNVKALLPETQLDMNVDGGSLIIFDDSTVYLSLVGS